MDRDEKIALVEKLAKEKYDEYFMAALWGSAKVLIPTTKLDVMIKVLEK